MHSGIAYFFRARRSPPLSPRMQVHLCKIPIWLLTTIQTNRYHLTLERKTYLQTYDLGINVHVFCIKVLLKLPCGPTAYRLSWNRTLWLNWPQFPWSLVCHPVFNGQSLLNIMACSYIPFPQDCLLNAGGGLGKWSVVALREGVHIVLQQ